MQRISPVHYFAPSAISVTPNANGSFNDLSVFVVRNARIKVYSPKAGVNTQNGVYQEWVLTGRNRRLSDSSKPYTVYARLPKNDTNGGYLVFAPKVLREGEWCDKYKYITTDGLADITGLVDSENWYVKLGNISLPNNGSRTLDLDTGILGTEQFNTEWAMNPDALPLRIDIGCTINDEDAGPTPYVHWNQSLVLTALLTEGWTGTDIERFDHWEIYRITGSDEAHTQADAVWAADVNAGVFRETGSIELKHLRGTGNQDDFNSAVNATFTVIAMQRTDDPEEGGTPVYAALKSASISIMAETWEKYELSLSAAMVTYNPETKTCNPSNGVKFNIRVTDQRGDVFLMSNKQVRDAGLTAQYAVVGVTPETWTTIPISGSGSSIAEGNIPASVFSSNQKSINIRLCDATLKELNRTTIAFLRDGEDSKEREWIFLRSSEPITFSDDPESEHPKPSVISGGEVNPTEAASGDDTNKNQDGWVPQGWWDEMCGTDAENPYEYGAYRDFVKESGGIAAHWGAFTTPRIWSHYGKTGADGLYYVDDYGRASSRELGSSGPVGFDSATGWVTPAPATTNTYLYIWKRSRQYNPNTRQYGTPSYTCLTGKDGESGKDAAEVNPNILLRTVFDRGMDFVKEKWTCNRIWDYISIPTTTPDTEVDGRLSVRVNAGTLNTGDYVDFVQDVYGSLKASTWYTLSFNFSATHQFDTFLWDGAGNVYVIDASAGMLADGEQVENIYMDGCVHWPAEWQMKRHTLTFKTSDTLDSTAQHFYIIFRTYHQEHIEGGIEQNDRAQTALCMPKLEIGQVATAYMANEDDLTGRDGATGESAVNVIISPASMIIEQDINNKDNIAHAADNNLGRFSMQVLKGSNVCNITSITASASYVYMSDSASAGEYIGDNCRTWTPSTPQIAEMFLKGIAKDSQDNYYSTGQIVLAITYRDPYSNTDKTITSIIAKVYVNLIGSWSEKVEGDIKSELANSSLFEIDDDPTSPTYGEVIERENWGEFYRSSTENISRLTSSTEKKNLFGIGGWKLYNNGTYDDANYDTANDRYYADEGDNYDIYSPVVPLSIGTYCFSGYVPVDRTFDDEGETIQLYGETEGSQQIYVYATDYGDVTRDVIAIDGIEYIRRYAVFDVSEAANYSINLWGNYKSYADIACSKLTMGNTPDPDRTVSQIKQTADEIDLAITNRLGETGINIQGSNRTIDITAAKVQIGNDQTATVFEGGKIKANFLEVDTIMSEGDGIYTNIQPGQFSLGVIENSVRQAAFDLAVDEEGNAVLRYYDKNGNLVGVIDSSFFNSEAIGNTWNPVRLKKVNNSTILNEPTYASVRAIVKNSLLPVQTAYKFSEGYTKSGTGQQIVKTYNVSQNQSPSEFNNLYLNAQYTTAQLRALIGTPSDTYFTDGTYVAENAIPMSVISHQSEEPKFFYQLYSISSGVFFFGRSAYAQPGDDVRA